MRKQLTINLRYDQEELPIQEIVVIAYQRMVNKKGKNNVIPKSKPYKLTYYYHN